MNDEARRTAAGSRRGVTAEVVLDRVELDLSPGAAERMLGHRRNLLIRYPLAQFWRCVSRVFFAETVSILSLVCRPDRR
jgi:hypothetical protein